LKNDITDKDFLTGTYVDANIKMPLVTSHIQNPNGEIIKSFSPYDKLQECYHLKYSGINI